MIEASGGIFMLDCLIIGGGPAGLAAAVYLARQKLRFAIIAKEVGGLALWSSDIENYLGFHLLDGADLIKRFREHLKDYQDGFTLYEGQMVAGIEKAGKGFRVRTDKEVLETRTILVATGETPRMLDVPGEKEFHGKGVTYCANCDAPLFANKEVTVIGGGNSAMDAALFLAKYTDQVTLITINKELMGDAVLRKRCLGTKGISILPETKVTSIMGHQFVSGIELQGKDGKKIIKSTQGVFIEIGLVPTSAFLDDLVEKNNWGEVIIDRHNQTSVPGIWAAGDVTDITEKQIAVAVGEGSKAALQIIKWLNMNPVAE
jgi:alkyl hydroperoxide reductase subunit F